MSKGKSKVSGRTAPSPIPQPQPQPQQQPQGPVSTYDDFIKSANQNDMYGDFLKLSEDERVDIITDIVNSRNIKVPSYLDSSETTKVMYALGLDKATTVVTDAQLDSMPGRELFRTVYEKGSMPPPSSDAILDQIRNGQYTQMSGYGGSAYGRAIYFATDYNGSATYGYGERNPMVMRAKIAPTAKVVKQSTLLSQMQSKAAFLKNSYKWNSTDAPALYAISQGIDGWYSGSYTMIVNRSALISSSQNKSIYASGGNGRSHASSWQTAKNAK